MLCYCGSAAASSSAYKMSIKVYTTPTQSAVNDSVKG